MEPPKYKIELPKPGEDKQYGGTRTVREGYNYDVGNQIGEGTYGQVFTGECKSTRTKVALKKIRMDSEKEGFPITAIREIKILSSLKHENVVNLREIVRSDIHKNNNYKGSIYMVFDYAEHDLTGLMDTCKYKFTEPQVKCIMKQLLKGLSYVHGNGVLHRDLKASNILIDKNGTVKLADFGLARTWQERQDANLTTRVITLWYRPPELLLGSTKYGPEVDMWSVGCILAELLVGKPLFPGKDDPDQLDRIFSIMGTPTPEVWPTVDKLPNWHMVPKGRYDKCRLRQWVLDTARAQKIRPPSDEAVQLLEKLLCLDPSRRLEAIPAFKDPWFWNGELPCQPMDLPVSNGSSHEYTMKKKRQEDRKDQAAAAAAAAHYAQGGGGGQYGHVDKRPRYNAPPSGGVSAGYGGGGRGGPAGYAASGRPAVPSGGGGMGPPGSRPSYPPPGQGPYAPQGPPRPGPPGMRGGPAPPGAQNFLRPPPPQPWPPRR